MSALAEIELGICDCETCRLLAALPIDKFRDTKERRCSLQMHKALRLAPSLDVLEALLRGESVPVSLLDPTWREAYGL